MYFDPREIKEKVNGWEFKKVFKSATGCDLKFSFYDPLIPLPENIRFLIQYDDVTFSISLDRIIRGDPIHEDYSRYRFKFTRNAEDLAESFIDVCISDKLLSELSDIDVFKCILTQATSMYVRTIDDRYIE